MIDSFGPRNESDHNSNAQEVVPVFNMSNAYKSNGSSVDYILGLKRNIDPNNSKIRHFSFNDRNDDVERYFAEMELQGQYNYNRRKSKSSKSNNLEIQDVQSLDDQPINNIGTLYWKGLNKIFLSRILTELSSLKELQRFLMAYIAKQQKVIIELHSKFVFQLEDRLISYEQKLKEKVEAQQQLMKSSMISMENELKQKLNENHQHVKQIQYLHNEISKLQRQKPESSSLKSSGSCPSCKLHQIKLNSIRDDAIQSGRQLTKVKSENQALQERIFDLEQQLVGIDLELEKRLKQALKILPQRAHPKQVNSKQTEMFMKDIEKLEARCKYYQQICKSEEELKEKEFQLNNAVREYQLKNQSLLEAIARSEETSDQNYEREHQLLLAEENLSTKIEQLCLKEAELSKWEAAITQKTKISTKPQHAFKTVRFDRNLELTEGENEVNVKNIGNQMPLEKQKQTQNNDYRVELPPRTFNYDATGTFRHEPTEEIHNKNNLIPMLPLGRHVADSRVQNNSRKVSKDHYSESSNNLNFPRQKAMESRYANRIVNEKRMKQSHSNKNIHENTFVQRGQIRNIKQDQLKRNSQIHREKHSSQTKNFRNSNGSFLTRSNVTYTGNYNDLESKLDRLREELRREIDSIK